MSSRANEGYLSQLRLLLEELCTDLCRFEHVVRDGVAPESVDIDREWSLGGPDAFADIRVAPGVRPAYLVEVKFGYSNETLLRNLARKYGKPRPALDGIHHLILVIDLDARDDWPGVRARIEAALPPRVKLEVWDERRLLQLLGERFVMNVPSITEENLLDVRQAIDHAKGIHAFGTSTPGGYEHDPLKAELLWHFGFWRLQKLRTANSLGPREILPPGLYRNVAVLLADLCSFSSYVRDTPDAGIVRESLTAFYSKSRYQIINNGGMLYQFVGDEVIGFFGIPDHSAGYVRAALRTAQELVSIGNSVSHHWQRRIDRVQADGGLHMGLAMGDLQIVSLRPFSRTHVGAIGDCINVAARLTSMAGPGEIVVSNSFYQGLDDAAQADFREVEPAEARNVGRIKAWKLSSRPSSNESHAAG